MNDTLFPWRPILILALLSALSLAPYRAGWGKPGDEGQDAANALPSLDEKVAAMTPYEGFFRYFWDQKAGKIWLAIDHFEQDFLYVNALSTGLGSNPVGLDRGQLGQDRVVRFERVGPQVFLKQRNLRYRALSENPAERQAVAESFAESILWGARIAAENPNGSVLVDLTDFLLQDAHHVTRTLKQSDQNTFQLDKTRSAVYLPRTRAFPRNVEFEVQLTFSSSEPGRWVRQTAPTPESITLRQHASFIQLPDDHYQPRRFDPRMPSMALTFADYATPIDAPLEKRWILRHRLKKKDPQAEMSEAVEPIIYYVDHGAPEPIRSALVEGASWWNQAFEAAGFKDAFQVKILPEDADPLDVRYNVIMWVHRSTRGWSYGSSVTDPRTGEILKGHVSLGSLRVRQDLLLMDGFGIHHPAGGACGCGSLIPHFAEAALAHGAKVSAKDVALARIRQLSAHEVGHTLGFAHNFAASVNQRASVMDYPAPQIDFAPDGGLDMSQAYAVGIGRWDKYAVEYAYREFADKQAEEEGLTQVIQRSLREGLLFLSDADARPSGAAHPLANLWDNGTDPVHALKHALEVRRRGMAQFSTDILQPGEPISNLQAAFVPLYLHHRYQVDAAVKMLGGVDYRYAVQGDGQRPSQWISGEKQIEALQGLLECLHAANLKIPRPILESLAPQAFGMSSFRAETFAGRTGMIFDPLSAAETAADPVIAGILQPERAARLLAPQQDVQINLPRVVDRLIHKTFTPVFSTDVYEAALQRLVQRLVVKHLMALARTEATSDAVRDVATLALKQLADRLPTMRDPVDVAHFAALSADIQRFLERPYTPARPTRAVETPPGSPIGQPAREVQR